MDDERGDAPHEVKGVDLTGILGGHKRRLGVWGNQKLKLFCETRHNICIKIQQTTVVAVTG